MQTSNYIPIILCGGDINYSHLPIGAHRSNSMIPVNGKPVIGWIFDDLEKKGFREVVVVLQFENQKLSNYLKWTYADRLDMHLAYVQPGGTILHSLLAGLSWVIPGKGIYIVLGDTLIEDSLPSERDFVFTGPYDEPENWCLAQVDPTTGLLMSLYDKQSVFTQGLSALAGGYALSRADVLRNIVVRQIQAQQRELSAALSLYNEIIPLRVASVKHWYDFGHIGGFNRARRSLLQSRYFNSLSIDPIRGIVTKRSEKAEKLEDELNWYHLLPKELKVFTPRVFSSGPQENQVEIVQEYYGYPNLAELFVFGDLDLTLWKNALHQLMAVHKQFHHFPCTLSRTDMEVMYREKTFERLTTLESEPEWKELLDQETIFINGKEAKNFPVLSTPINSAIDGLLKQSTGTAIHGDYCFSNILYDLQTQIIRLIDPRGSFGQKGIYGDPRYDMAKLRHSVNGLYDFIIADLFSIEKAKESHTYQFKVFKPEKQEVLSDWLDQLITENGYNLNEILLIEALLFLSMLPYHAGKPKRQLAMYLTGILKLNQLFALEATTHGNLYLMSGNLGH